MRMPKRQYDQSEYQELASKYRPLLVLYPEILSNSVRTKHPSWRAGGPPLTHDYHPRDIRLVLENAAILGNKSEPGDWHIMLDKMEAHRRKRIDVVVGAGPGDRNAFWERYAAIDKSLPKYDRRCYAHVVEGRGSYKGLLAIEYWYAYLYNDWKTVHEMDWEEVVIVLRINRNRSTTPLACAYSAHHGGYRLRWTKVEKVDDRGNRNDKNGTHPVVYIAQGSHANYFFGGQTYATTSEVFNGLFIQTGKFPFTGEFIDFVTSFDEGDRQLVEAVLVPLPPVRKRWTGEWRWLNFRGRWGSRGSLLHPLVEQDAPHALAKRTFQWHDPFLWVDELCQESPGHPTWLLR